jgi:hypothetical protein
MTEYWPGTKIVKSKNNAFNWQSEKTALTDNKKWKQSIVGAFNASFNKSLKKSSVNVYSKAKSSK